MHAKLGMIVKLAIRCLWSQGYWYLGNFDLMTIYLMTLELPFSYTSYITPHFSTHKAHLRILTLERKSGNSTPDGWINLALTWHFVKDLDRLVNKFSWWILQSNYIEIHWKVLHLLPLLSSATKMNSCLLFQ